ncbi:MAG: hypothetical protein BGO78_00040 [Chloroflexi bacterium 44-23]|nr:MAG: hypothetical protein BGO78_00040 [Chloroflexi bacterium 44-23]
MTQQKGIKVKVLTYGFYEDSFFEGKEKNIFIKEFTYKGIPVTVFKYIDQPMDLHISLNDDSTFKFAKEFLKREKPDIIHVGHSMRVHQFVLAALELNIPYIMTLTDFFLICPKIILAPNQNSLCSGPEKGSACKILCSEFDNRFIIDRLELAKKILFKAKAVISPSVFLARMFIKEFEKLPIVVNQHGIDFGNIKTNEKVYSANSILNFGFAGTFIYHKGLHILINAFNNINNGNARLIIYGRGEPAYTSRIMELCEGNKNIEFRGSYNSDQLPTIYQEIDVIIFPSIWYENFPFVLQEAFASNVPVIGSNLGATADIVINNVNGFTFQPGNPEDLSDKIMMLIGNPELINSLKENIRTHTQATNIEQESYFYWKLYRKVGMGL